MKPLPELQPALLDLTERFGERIQPVQVARPNEVYLQAPTELVPGLCAQLYRKCNARLVSLFADDARAHAGVFHLYYAFALDTAHGFIILRVPVSPAHPQFTSLTNALPAVNWQEREIQDLFGLRLEGHPNPRRCALHDDWPDVYPLRKDFDLRASLPPFTGERHKFRKVEGEGVFQVPVGPVHAGIIEPGHFLFSVAGEPVLYLQIRLFYTHKGTEKLFENIPVTHGVTLAESISGDSSFAHATAFCHAVERAADLEVPPRARALRSVCLELERIYNHVADIGAIATDVAFVVANAHAMRLKERMLRLNEQLTGNRLLRGMAALGGVRYDWSATQIEALIRLAQDLRPEFESLVALILESSSTLDRLETTGILKPEAARDLGVVGIAGRASGFEHDLRRDFPHAAYDRVAFPVPVFQEGDVLRRLQVRVEEVRAALSIIEQLAAALPDGKVRVSLPSLPPDAVALGYVEGWRGEIFHWIRTGPGGRLARCKVKDPSLQNWPALSEAILGNIVPDFPVVNKSFNLSYSGTDR
ncbi:MAG TPA: NADH-quinone oxidoreductase subunit C [Candidatus Paceibacterota bacterium]|nr:NADH-quinone oxidoreductase subunit C [Verrucomicrobiota bacterium]HSA11230.1 NADH-quinone oxidoreductase subunit C [Candidatus Paceibacterota bacterium]